jgi:hypothetical protein
VPSLALAFLFWMLAGAHPAFFLLTAPAPCATSWRISASAC